MENALYFIDRQFWKHPELVMLFSCSLFLVVLLRYLVLSSAYHWLISRLFQRSRRNFSQGNRRQWRRELKWSLISTLVFTALGTLSLWLYHEGHTKIYTKLSQYSIGYFFLTVVILLAGYETYYYWLHRWMHHPKVFRIVHKVHHDSIHTSVFTSFSFHPLEAVLQFIFIPLVAMVIPIHYYALGIVLTLMTISAIINHASTEIFPKGFHQHKIGRWLIGATHHDLHHKEFRTNFGLYFTFWDKWLKTESSRYGAKFEAHTTTDQSGGV